VDDWKPTSGQVALIELGPDDATCLTGVVLDTDGKLLLVDLGASARRFDQTYDVTVSVFDPDALYRIEATLLPHDGTESIVDLKVRDVERIQRRVALRAKRTLPVVLSNLDDPRGAFASIAGETLDISEGGCRVVVARRFPAGCDPTVTLELPNGETLVALAAILEEIHRSDGRCEYRLVFIEPDDGHREILADLIATAA